jgi:serine/threonine protein kinase
MSKIIGKGQSGYVYRPALACKHKLSDDKYISKVMSEANALSELETYRNLGLYKIDPDRKYYLGQPQECQPVDTSLLEASDVPKRVLNYRDGGKTIKEIIRTITDKMKGQYKTQYDARASITRLLRELRNIFEAVAVLNSNGVYHCDINTNNIVYEPGYGMRLIDFGVSQRPPHYTHYESFRDSYWPWPIEMNLLNGKDRLTVGDYRAYKMPEWVPIPSDRELARINSLSPEDIVRGIDVWQLGCMLVYLSFVLMKPNTIDIVSAMRDVGMKLVSVVPKDRPTAERALQLYDDMLKKL